MCGVWCPAVHLGRGSRYDAQLYGGVTVWCTYCTMGVPVLCPTMVGGGKVTVIQCMEPRPLIWLGVSLCGAV